MNDKPAETKTEAPGRNVPMPMPVGGEVVAVVPQSVEEMFRVAKGIVQSKLAPYALTGKIETADDMARATSAVVVVMMAGAELGLPPMVALRSFTAINNRPALYGDGLINVVRRSGRAKKIDVGFKPGAKNYFDDDAAGYCEAERSDTGETKRVDFTVRQAKRAGLWDEREKVERWNRFEKKNVVGPNESPWYRYPERMLGWRAAGFCLRELFGDVLGGITDDWEAREIGGMIDVTPPAAPIQPPTPEEPTEPSRKSDEKNSEAIQDEPAGEQHVEEGEAPDPEKAAAERVDPDTGEIIADTSDVGRYLDDLDTALMPARDEETVTRLYEQMGVDKDLADDEDALDRALAIRAKHMARVERIALAEQGQGDIFPSDKP